MNDQRTTYASYDDGGKICIIDGTSCIEGYCREFGCDFPDCATLSGETFDTEEAARAAYPNLEMV